MVNWALKEDLRILQLDFIESIERNLHICEIAKHGIKDFPNNLPQELQEALKRDITRISVPDHFPESKIVLETSIIRMYVDYEGSIDLEMEFITELYNTAIDAQHLILLFTSMEAYLQDLARIVYQIDPRILISEKKISIEDVVKAGDWNILLGLITEKIIQEIGKKTFSNLIVSYINFISIKVKLTDKEKTIIDDSYCERNLWVHNNGKVDLNFIEKCNKSAYSIGTLYHIKEENLYDFRKTIMQVQRKIHKEVINKYFKT